MSPAHSMQSSPSLNSATSYARPAADLSAPSQAFDAGLSRCAASRHARISDSAASREAVRSAISSAASHSGHFPRWCPCSQSLALGNVMGRTSIPWGPLRGP